MLKTVADGVDVCLTATLLDGLVLARSVFHHSMNYRSVVVLGRAREVTDPEAKMSALQADRRSRTAGPVGRRAQAERRRVEEDTGPCAPLDEASAKVRSGPAGDEEEDLALPVWAGVIPLTLTSGRPIPDDLLPKGTPLPPYLSSRH